MPTSPPTRLARASSWACPSDVAGGDAHGGGGDAATLHATCVSVSGNGMLITGRSGAGKSALALRMMALGAQLVADDRTRVTRHGDGLVAAAPEAIRGRIEARFVGILDVPCAGPAPVRLIVDLDHEETERLPPARRRTIMGCAVPVVHKSTTDHFPAALMLYLDAQGRE